MARFSPAGLLFLIILVLLFTNPGSTPDPSFSVGFVSSVIAEERRSLSVLNSSDYGILDAKTSADNVLLNLTGFREDDGFYWNLLPSVKTFARSQQIQAVGDEVLKVETGVSNITLALHQNVTGWVRGSWVRGAFSGEQDSKQSKNSSIDRRIAKFGRPFTHNITGSEGKIFLSLQERESSGWIKNPGNLKRVSGRVTVQDVTSVADEWFFNMNGLQNLKTGSIVLTTTSDDYAGIFALPHFQLSEQAFEESRQQLLESLSKTINKQEARRSDFVANPWGNSASDLSDGISAPQCELIAYFQQHVLNSADLGFGNVEDTPSTRDADMRVLEELERDARMPTGLYLPTLPALRLSGTLFSPDCGYLIMTKGPPEFAPQDGRHLVGPRFEVRVEQARLIMILLAVSLALQLMLLVSQINEVNTPSKKSRISFWTLVILSLGSGFSSLTFLLLSWHLTRLFVLTLSVAFLSFMDGLFFTMRFFLDVWTIQEPERLESRRTQHNDDGNDASAQTVTQTDSTGPTATSTSGPESTAPQADVSGAAAIALPVMTTPAAQITPPTTTIANINTPQSFGSLYTRYCLFLLSVVFISMWAASSWPRTVQSFYANALVFAYLSFWTPQIYRNITRNCRKALSKRFVIGQSLLRLLPIAYFWAIDENVLFVDTDTSMLAVFAAWLWIQIIVLVGQEVIGPRFFVSERWSWIPPAWEYHPILREDEEGATLPLGYNSLSRTNSNDSYSGGIDGVAKSDGAEGFKTFDCAICMQHIEVPVVPSSARASSTSVSQRTTNSTAADVLSGGFMTRRHYSVTPCRHIFHSECLESWVGYRLQCPICREALPPL